MQRTRPSRRGARDDARGKLGWWSNERRGEGGLVLDCGRTGIPAGVLPAIAPGSERPSRPIPSESDKTKNKLNMSVKVCKSSRLGFQSLRSTCRNHRFWCGRA